MLLIIGEQFYSKMLNILINYVAKLQNMEVVQEKNKIENLSVKWKFNQPSIAL